MTFECRDLDRALETTEPALLADARAHAAGCPGCDQRLRAWDAVGTAARSLGQDWDTPGLWPRIHQALAEENVRREARRRTVRWLPLTALAASVVAAVITWVAIGPRPVPSEAVISDDRFLTERALGDVEQAEARYVASIDRLARLAEPTVSKPTTPLLASYREKLQLLDAAIEDCRGQIQQNRFHAQLRRELLKVYQEKQRTLEQLMGETT